MEREKSIKRNFLMNIMLTMSQFIFPLITFPYISRVLSVDGVGRVSFATSLISYFTMFSQLGVPTYGIRVCAKIRNDKNALSKTVQELLCIRFITTTISYLTLFILVRFVDKLQVDRKLYFVISLNILFTFLGVEWLYKALEQYTYITIRSIFFKFIALIAMLLFVRQKDDYIIYGGISIFAASASSILNFVNLHRFVSLKPQKEYNLVRHLKPVLIFFAMSCATTIYTHLDSVMLGFCASEIDVGYYAAAVKSKSILVSVITSLGAVLLPRSSYYIEHNKWEEFNRITQKAYNFVFMMAVPMTVYFVLFSKECIVFLSGEDFLKATPAMMIIMPTLLFIGLSNTSGMQILVPLGKEKIVLYSEVAGAIVDLILNFLFIPMFGAAGAAIGTVVSEFVVMCIQFCYAQEILRPMIKKIQINRYFLATMIAILLSGSIKVFIHNNLAVLFLSASLFYLVYCIMLFATKDEMFLEIVEQVKNKIVRNKK